MPESEYYIRFAWDWGTSKFSASAEICRQCDDELIAGPVPIRFRNKKWEIPMIAAWDEAELFLTGLDLLSRIQNDPSLTDNIIDHFKLAFYNHPDTAARRDRIGAILARCGDKKQLDLMVESFKAMNAECRNAITKTSFDLGGVKGAYFTKEQIAAMPYEVCISVPQMWTPDARRNYQIAAKMAGLPKVALVSEPQCALAVLIHRLEQLGSKIPTRLRKGSKVLVADLGAGTADFALYEFLTDLSIEALLAALTQASGDIYGGVRIEEQVFDGLTYEDYFRFSDKLAKSSSASNEQTDGTQESQEAGWERVARECGWSSNAFRHRVLQLISDTKPDFETKKEHWFALPPSATSIMPLNFTISRDTYKNAFDVVIARIVSKIDEMLDASFGVEMILVTGGTGNSAYVMDELCKRYEPHGIEVLRPSDGQDMTEGHEVSLGALRRYKNITTQSLPSRYGYAALRREGFDSVVHVDAMRVDGKPDLDYVLWDDVEKGDVVEDRLFTVFKKGERLVPGQTLPPPPWDMCFQVDPRKPEICATFVCLTEDKPDGSRGRDLNGAYTTGVLPWAKVTLPVDLRKLRQLRCPFRYAEVDGQKRRHYLVKGRLRMECLAEGDIKLGVELYAANGQSNEAQLPQRGVARRVVRAEAQPPSYIISEDLWDANFSEFMDEKDDGDAMEIDG